MNKGLVEAIRSHSAVVVVGTGLSSSASAGAPAASWFGLIESGISRLIDADLRDEGWGETVRAMLSQPGTSFVVQAASQVGDAYKELGDVAFAKWLRETVGDLHPVDTTLAVALTSLPIPILTTNYDTLLEQVSRRGSASWLDSGSMQQILANRSVSIGHLHGVWTEPSSIVLTDGDYHRLRSSDSARAIQQAFGTSKSSIYVGVGDGLSDPNFSRFLAWQRDTFPNPGLRDFRLCLDSELEALTREHIADNIEVIAYGAAYDELPAFLAELARNVSDLARSDEGLLLDPAGEVRADFEANLRSEIIVSQNDALDGSSTLESLMLTPILLPVPHADYVTSRSGKDGLDSIQRLDPEKDLQIGEVVILIGEENSGLSFAAKWLALRASQVMPLLAPIYFNFTQARDEPKPLLSGIRQQIRASGITIGRKDKLPAVALAIDDFSPYVVRVSERSITDLKLFTDDFIVVACKLGTEDDVKLRLEAAGFKTRLRYVGRLERSDIVSLARIASPTQFGPIADSVIALLRSEHLPRTPFTVSQLIYIYLNSGAMGTNASSTSILEEYVALLLGRGDAYDDARIGLDHVQRMAILERFAERLVRNDTAGLSEADAVAAIASIIDNLGWPESAIVVVADFIKRSVLANQNGFITFARSSYLHLFAAKQAQKAPSFRDLLLTRPLYYEAAISDYASLNRHDEVLLDKVELLVASLNWTATNSPVFAEIELREPSFEEPKAAPEKSSDAGNPDPMRTDDHLGEFDDEDPPPFPVANEDEQPRLWVVLQTIDLASRILRDADQAGNVARKSELLGALFQQWGDLIAELNHEESFQQLAAELTETLRNTLPEQGSTSPSHGTSEDIETSLGESEIVDEFSKILPAAIAFGGINGSLASRKLLKALENLLGAETPPTPEAAVSQIFFILAIREKGWSSQVKKVLEGQTNTWVIRNFVLLMLVGAYFDSENDQLADEDLLDAIMLIFERAYKYANENERKRHVAANRASLKQARDLERLKAKARARVEQQADPTDKQLEKE